MRKMTAYDPAGTVNTPENYYHDSLMKSLVLLTADLSVSMLSSFSSRSTDVPSPIVRLSKTKKCEQAGMNKFPKILARSSRVCTYDTMDSYVILLC